MTATNRARRPKRLLLAGLVLLAPLALITASSALTVDLVPVKADPDINEFLPAASGDRLAWTANSAAHPASVAFVQQAGHAKERINPAGTSGEAGGFDGDSFVWTQWSEEAAGDIWRINLSTHVRARFGPAVNTRYGEYYPTMSGTWLLFTRYNWDTKRFQVILFNKSNGHKRLLTTGTPSHWAYSGQVNGDYVTYSRGSGEGSNVFRYTISTGTTLKLPNSAVHAYEAGVAADGTVFYVRSNSGCGANVDLVRYQDGGPAEKLRDLAAGVDVWRNYVDDRADGSREVHVGRVACARNKTRRMDTYKFVDSYLLTVEKSGTGTGMVTSDPAGIDCGLDCTEAFVRGATVTLTATPDLGSTVTGWSVAGCGTSTVCTVDVEARETVTVTFGLLP